jgi:hypothetical protein
MVTVELRVPPSALVAPIVTARIFPGQVSRINSTVM